MNFHYIYYLKIIKYGISVKDEWVPESKKAFQDNNFIRKVNKDLYSIKKEYKVGFHNDLY